MSKRCFSFLTSILLLTIATRSLVAQSAREKAGEVPKAVRMIIGIDDSGSIAGYARGGGLYGRLWTEHFDRVYQQIGATSLSTRLIGSTIRVGPGLNGLVRYASPAMYQQQHTTLVRFFSEPQILNADSSTVLALVSDLEPASARQEGANCLGNGSLSCLEQAMNLLIDSGWNFWIIGFQNPFRGQRFYFRLTDSGFIESSNSLEGERVPIYVMVASRSATLGASFAAMLRRQLSTDSDASRASLRSLQLTCISLPKATIAFEAALNEVFQSARVRGKIVPRSRAEVAFRLSEGKDGAANALIKIYNDVHPASFDLPLTLIYSQVADTHPDVQWQLRADAETTGSGGSVPVAITEPVYDPRRSDVRRSLQVDLSARYLQMVTRDRDAIVRLRIMANVSPTLADIRPFADWSYHAAGDRDYKTRTFRTDELLAALIRKSFGRYIEAVPIGEFQIRLRHN